MSGGSGPLDSMRSLEQFLPGEQPRGFMGPDGGPKGKFLFIFFEKEYFTSLAMLSLIIQVVLHILQTHFKWKVFYLVWTHTFKSPFLCIFIYLCVYESYFEYNFFEIDEKFHEILLLINVELAKNLAH